MTDKNHSKEIQELHEEACENGLYFYIDPKTGLQVSTRYQHLKRGFCCKSGCRHCPWDYKKKSGVQKP